MTTIRIGPPYPTLTPGATIGIVAPAGPTLPERLDPVVALIESFGWRARLYPGCRHHGGYLAGPDAQRIADLHAAFADPEVALVWCLRGGYGSGRLLRGLDPALVRRHPKLVVGYSDITALHAWLHHAGLPALHAPMPASDLVQPGRDDDARALVALLRDGLRAGTTWQPALAAGVPNVAGVAEGVLVGGNLSLVASLLGTPWAWPMAGSVLFLEDINEEPYRVDRLLNQLDLAGALDAAAGFLLGSFSEQAAPEEAIEHFLLRRGKPLLGGWPAGHGTPNRPLPLGLRVRLDATAGSLTMLDELIVPPPAGTTPARP